MNIKNIKNTNRRMEKTKSQSPVYDLVLPNSICQSLYPGPIFQICVQCLEMHTLTNTASLQDRACPDLKGMLKVPIYCDTFTTHKQLLTHTKNCPKQPWTKFAIESTSTCSEAAVGSALCASSLATLLYTTISVPARSIETKIPHARN